MIKKIGTGASTNFELYSGNKMYEVVVKMEPLLVLLLHPPLPLMMIILIKLISHFLVLVQL
jgi:hypothetical protein